MFSNTINVFNFQVGHNIPESKGGTLSLNNLKPICGRCNFSMGNNYTIDEWNNFCESILLNIFFVILLLEVTCYPNEGGR